MGDKLFVSAEQLYRDSFELAHRIFTSGYVPDVLAAVWRGGAPVGAIVHEYLEWKDVKTKHHPVKTSSYNHDGQRGKVVVEGIEPLIRALTKDSRLLIVDDVFDTGLSIDALIESSFSNGDILSRIKIATVFYKPVNNKTFRTPDFYIHETDRWIVFPHEVIGLDTDELALARGGIFKTS